ncbi:MAG: electron transfer flavoprotein subunit beta/FixA family protein [Sulfolobales archaeon]|nr:electron transfer flavoprotein subunit beta/FixA family protein [Sulfolobales archaeon]MDW8082719.1 electron transfer flavoprotein subunit beta/FixA family protein [Sulfolobales archaeon]
MPVNVVVLMKPVVDPKAIVNFRPDGTIDRSAVKLVVNPYDKYAIEAAVQLKEKLGGKVVGIAMAPLHAVDSLREALAIGVDEFILLSDLKLAGSDTLATSYALSAAIRKIWQKLGSLDLILCGIESSDSNTGHIGPEVGEWLGLPSVSYVDSILEVRDGSVLVKRLIEGGYVVMKVKLPAVLSIAGTSYQPRIPALREVLAARRKQITVWNTAEVGIDQSLVGLAGSPTRVVRMWRIEIKRRGKIFSDPDVDKMLEKFLEEIRRDGISLGVRS